MRETILAGHYQIVRPLGGGGFGQTFLATDSHLPGNPICVVKKLQPKTKDPTALQTAKRLFDREAETLYRLGDSDRIPRLLAHFEQDGEFYLVQEYIEGRSLDKELATRQPYREAEVISLLRDILRGLTFVHQNNVIHRDIKPANLIREKATGKIVLIDFGAVKEVSARSLDGSGDTSITVAIGSPGYMPGEQLSFRPHFSSDIYATGMVCFEALTGSPPREILRDSLNEISCDFLGDKIVVTPGLAAILDKMVRYDYRQRYQNASEALLALDELLDRRGENLDKDIHNVPTALISFSEETVSSQVATAIEPTAPPASIASTGSGSWEEPEGQVSLDSPFYVERPPIELDCYEAIEKPAGLIRVKAPRQMGKSSLMSRILNHASQQGYKTASLNFQSADAEFFANLDLFLQWFCAIITEELELEEKLDKYWKGPLGSKNKCSKYFQRYLLSEIESPIALGLDEVDLIFQYPEIATDFFGLLRAWHERGKNEALWKKLRLTIVHSKEVYIPLNINQSPFNVGLPVELPELTEAQVGHLVVTHGLDWRAEEIEKLMAMVGGHPYLVRRALYQIARGRMTLAELLQVAPTEEGPYSDRLRHHLLNLEENPDLMAAIKEVVAAESPVEIGTAEGFKLRSMGLVKFQGNAVMPLCNLYRQYFGDRLN
ncbi:MAG: protein kinase [Oscillatoria sp. SIO1A7]|nr:protein kinase [Oscillatoria sp. SIO1A7]